MLTPTYQPKLPRWAHQNRAMDAVNGSEAFALFMEMRTGKTKVILDEFGQDVAAGNIKHLLVIAPAGVYRTWEADAEKHLSEELLQRVQIERWESKASSKVKRGLLDFGKGTAPKILLINIEALSTIELARTVCMEFATQAPTTIVIDESTVIKNGKAERTRFCLRLGPLGRKRRILSGLPTPQGPLDIYTQFDFLQPGLLGYRSYTRFEQRYGVVTMQPFGPGGRLVKVVTSYQNLDELQERVGRHSFRVRLEECYDLPEKMYLRRDIELTKEQHKAYSEMLAYATALLENMERVTATIVLTQMLRLHQILTGYTMSDSGALVDIPENRTDEMLSILENHKGKAIIWAAYDQNVRRITDRLVEVYGPGSVARFWGGNADTREAEERQFKTDPKCRFMVATPSAGGRGRTWDVADLMIYYSNTFNLEHRMQSEERAQMVGKANRVAYFDLACRGTVEDKILHALRNKMNLSNAVTGDDWKQWIV